VQTIVAVFMQSTCKDDIAVIVKCDMMGMRI